VRDGYNDHRVRGDFSVMTGIEGEGPEMRETDLRELEGNDAALGLRAL